MWHHYQTFNIKYQGYILPVAGSLTTKALNMLRTIPNLVFDAEVFIQYRPEDAYVLAFRDHKAIAWVKIEDVRWAKTEYEIEHGIEDPFFSGRR